MAYFKALFVLAALAALAYAEEGVRTKKDILLANGLALATRDDGSWFPGKYDPTFLPASYSAMPMMYSSYAYPSAYPSAYHSAYSALPAAYPYAYSGIYKAPLML